MPTTSSVEPPPMSTTRNGPSAGSRSATAPRKESSASSRPVTISAAGRGSVRPAVRTRPGWRRLGSRRWPPSVPRSRRTPAGSRCSRPTPPRRGPAHRATSGRSGPHLRRASPPAARGARRPWSTPPPNWSGPRPAAASSSSRSRSPRPAGWTGPTRSPSGRRRAASRRPARHGCTRASSATASSPSGFTPAPTASEWATSTCRHLTLVGIPPALTEVPRSCRSLRSAR